ncbi:peptidase [Jeongeupia sp. HS-3]|uniref:D-alanyl-D-alanine carboxypeptidase family protein n=1 Tax=Jeongeupia sp. HS-3 TaxID=1009682 RepID=UPI0018A34AE6|nr:D-alanyl-D-alanine carboxypeptidase family protein [Jeongeupia sp. HS-3]BCL76350.1 peptidase [Jeongeupia sp. HS-3]
MNIRRTFALAALVTPLISMTAQAFTPPPPDIAAKAYFLSDFQSGATLAARDADTRIEPASLTKLMTAYVVFKAIKEGKLKLDQQLTVSAAGMKAGGGSGGSTMFLDPRTPATVDQLIKGMIVQSGNDACVTLAEAIAGNEEVFAQLMNREAQRLGMKNSHFSNSTGLTDPNLYTTTADLGKIAAAIIHDFPQFYPIYSMKDFTFNNIKQGNRNLLLYRDPYVDGMKTGHTSSAGYNLVASSKRDGRRVISVVVGTSSDQIRAAESSKLLNWGVQFFDTPKIYSAGQSIATVPVWKGKADSVKAGFLQDRYLTVPKGDAAKIKLEFISQQPLIAPIAKGQQIGAVKVNLDGKTIGNYPVVAIEAVQEAGVFGRAWDALRLWFKQLFA